MITGWRLFVFPWYACFPLVSISYASSRNKQESRVITLKNERKKTWRAILLITRCNILPSIYPCWTLREIPCWLHSWILNCHLSWIFRSSVFSLIVTVLLYYPRRSTLRLLRATLFILFSSFQVLELHVNSSFLRESTVIDVCTIQVIRDKRIGTWW